MNFSLTSSGIMGKGLPQTTYTWSHETALACLRALRSTYCTITVHAQSGSSTCIESLVSVIMSSVVQRPQTVNGKDFQILPKNCSMRSFSCFANADVRNWSLAESWNKNSIITFFSLTHTQTDLLYILAVISSSPICPLFICPVIYCIWFILE